MLTLKLVYKCSNVFDVRKTTFFIFFISLHLYVKMDFEHCFSFLSVCID
jgi:hypothetical protein